MEKASGNFLKLKKGIFQLIRKTVGVGGRIIPPFCRRNQRIMNILSKINGRLMNATTVKPNNKIFRSIRAVENIKGGFGVNIAGYITAESGVGESVRANIRAVEKAGIPFVLNNTQSPSRKGDVTYKDLMQENNPYVFNLVQTNADAFLIFFDEKGIDYFIDKYNIGFWYWELSNFPNEWVDRFQYLNEVWVASDFCREAISKVSPIPVVKIPPSVVVEKIKDAGRPHFGLEEDSFIFFFMFDFFSYFERKNPMAVLKAFKAAFKAADNVQLLLKCSNSDWNPAARDRLIDEAKGLNVKFIDSYLAKAEINSLLFLTDCYVSLHRSEGFGLPLAEAMYLGKPVIATGYSSNTDFMNEHNSFPVRYRLVEIESDFGPYKKGNVWAEPDIGHAAELMRLVYEDRALSRRIGERASKDIRRDFSPEATGKKILSRLEQIIKERGIKIS